jgi:hypothetical protein
MKNSSILSLIIFFILFGSCSSTDLHNLNNTIRTGSTIIDNGNRLVNDGKRLINSVKMTKAEFDNTVTVFKSGSSATKRSSIPRGKATKFEIKRGSAQNLEWQPFAYFDNQLFPSAIISMATYKGSVDGSQMNSIKSSALGIMFKSNSSFMPIKWEIESSDKSFFDKVSGEFVSQKPERTELLMPDIPWNITALAKQNSSTPINMIYRLYDDNGNKTEKPITLFMRSVNDCIYQYNDIKLDFLFTAYIQEQHPEIDVILKEALATKFINSIDGLQGNISTAKQIQAVDMKTIYQVAAIWKVLHDRGIKYSSITATSTNSTSNLRSQNVRPFGNSIKNKQANCVDGTIVFASILRAINIPTTLVLTHNHCFLGFYTNPTSKYPLYLETTMLSQSNFIRKAKTSKQKNDAYFKQFAVAINYAMKEYEEYKANNDITEINVNQYRSVVRPLPF